MTRAIIVDIDGTISDGRNRLHFVRPPEGVSKDYAAFHSRCGEDPVIESVVSLVRAVANNYGPYTAIMLVTGRPDNYREQTYDWLDKGSIPYDELHMRPEGDNRSAPEYKKGVLGMLQAKGYEVLLAFEDQQNVVDMWRENGIHCLQTQAVG